ncbi:hypothetical protein ACFFU9_16175 [Mariniflexile ostreae]|uniref:Lipoprotein n=1 Tax=Mariniflexile ostreae TaxID=1520892 RepID=A0ABV5FGU2_9FLAO
MIKNSILLILLVTLIGCDGKSYYEKKQEELAIEKRNYQNELSSSHKKLIQNILEEDIYLNKTTIPKKKSILVIQKRKGEIIPYISMNNKIKSKGHNVTYKSEELDYIVVVKSKGVKSGQYSDGSNAWDNETNIYVIDTKTEKTYLVASEYQKAPDKVQKSRNSTHSDYGARGIEGNKLAELIIDKVLR